jgi:hypothetical protein
LYGGQLRPSLTVLQSPNSQPNPATPAVRLNQTGQIRPKSKGEEFIPLRPLSDLHDNIHVTAKEGKEIAEILLLKFGGPIFFISHELTKIEQT